MCPTKEEGSAIAISRVFTRGGLRKCFWLLSQTEPAHHTYQSGFPTVGIGCAITTALTISIAVF